jgi:hypothetical protein
MLEATKTQMKTNLKLYLEYLECYDQSLYIDQYIEFELVVGIIRDLLHTQEEIWAKYSMKRVRWLKAKLRHVNEYWKSLLQIYLTLTL